MNQHFNRLTRVLGRIPKLIDFIKLVVKKIKIKIRRYYFIREFKYCLKQWELAEMLFYNKKYVEAIDHYTVAIDSLPGIGEWYKGRGNCKRLLGRFDENTKNDFFVGVEKACYRKTECIRGLLNYLWETEGFTSNYLEKYESIILKENTKRKNAFFLSSYAAMYNGAGNIQKAVAFYNKAKSLKKDSVVNLIALTGTISKNQSGEVESHKEDLKLFQYLKTHEKTLEKLLQKYNNSIAVVGNSPKELGKGQGEIIDQHDLIVRFNDYSVAPPYDKDYGAKTNIWVRSIGDWVPLRDIGEYKLIMVSGMNLIHRYRDWRMISSYTKQSKPIVLFPAEIQYELIEKLRAVPTAGITFCYMLYKIIGPLNPNSMFGFSFTDHIGEKAVPSHYYDSRPPSERHNWHAEKALFHQLLK